MQYEQDSFESIPRHETDDNVQPLDSHHVLHPHFNNRDVGEESVTLDGWPIVTAYIGVILYILLFLDFSLISFFAELLTFSAPLYLVVGTNPEATFMGVFAIFMTAIAAVLTMILSSTRIRKINESY